MTCLGSERLSSAMVVVLCFDFLRVSSTMMMVFSVGQCFGFWSCDIFILYWYEYVTFRYFLVFKVFGSVTLINFFSCL